MTATRGRSAAPAQSSTRPCAALCAEPGAGAAAIITIHTEPETQYYSSLFGFDVETLCAKPTVAAPVVASVAAADPVAAVESDSDADADADALPAVACALPRADADADADELPAVARARPQADADADALPAVARALPRPKITPEKAQLVKTWLSSKYTEWKGTWPRCGATNPAICAQLERLGVTATQAQRQLQALRIEKGDVGTRGSSSSSVVMERRTAYCDLLLAALDCDGIYDVALASAASSPYFKAQPRLKFYLTAAKSSAFVRDAAHIFLCGLADESSEAWAARDHRGPLHFATGRWQTKLPAFQRQVYVMISTAHRSWKAGSQAPPDHEDCYAVAALLAEEMYKGYCRALALGAKPAIVDPDDDAEPTASESATVYYIAGWLLHVISRKLGHDDNSNTSRFCRDFVETCSLPRAAAVAKQLPIGKVDAATRGGLRYPNSEFFGFIKKLESYYLANLTDAHLDAYPSDLATRIREEVRESGALRLALRAVSSSSMPLDSCESPPPAELFELICEKYGMMRVKDLAKSLDRAHARVRRFDASAGTTTHRANMQVIAANARASGEKGRKRKAEEENPPS